MCRGIKATRYGGTKAAPGDSAGKRIFDKGVPATRLTTPTGSRIHEPAFLDRSACAIRASHHKMWIVDVTFEAFLRRQYVVTLTPTGQLIGFGYQIVNA
jgi:hypothetical protein